MCFKITVVLISKLDFKLSLHLGKKKENFKIIPSRQRGGKKPNKPGFLCKYLKM